MCIYTYITYTVVYVLYIMYTCTYTYTERDSFILRNWLAQLGGLVSPKPQGRPAAGKLRQELALQS